MEEMPPAVELAPQQSRPRRSSSRLPPLTEDSGDTCRICRSEVTLNQPLFHPCKCNGSIKHVHQNCLMEWLSYSQKKHCDLCKTTFRFTKLYDPSMPDNVAWTLFGKQVVVHSLRAIGRWTRYSIVAIIWLCWLPWTIHQIWRALFWIADGSWLATEELVAAVQKYGSHQPNTSSSSLSNAIANTIFTRHVATNVGLFAPAVTILVFLDPHIIFRVLIGPVLQLAVSLTMQDEHIKWEGALLLALMLRLSSLLSVFEISNLATRFPIPNNAILDVLEGQLLCLTILTAVMLVIHGRGRVINEQPLPNLPEEEQPENAPPPRPVDEERRAARMYRRALRPLADENTRHENREGLHPEHRLRRRATENGIRVPSPADLGRPHAPSRAQSLIPTLQALEDNAHLPGDFGSTVPYDPAHRVLPTVESRSLQRRALDKVNQKRRATEEASPIHPITNTYAGGSPVSDESDTIQSERISLPPGQTDEVVAGDMFPSNTDTPTTLGMISGGRDSNFRSAQKFADKLVGLDAQSSTTPLLENIEPDLDSDDEPLLTPNLWQTVNEGDDLDEDAQADTRAETNEIDQRGGQDPAATMPDAQPNAKGSSVLEGICRWLWQTDDIVMPETAGVESVANVDAQDLLAAPEPDLHGTNNSAVILDPAPPALPNRQPVVPQVAPIDQNAIDAVEELAELLELPGMKSSIADMVQNIITWIVFITLTLSASVWSPYIWGKITLLCVAHPFSVFIEAPLFVLWRTADIVIDLGLLTIGVTGMLLTNIARMIKLATFPLVPHLSTLLNTDLMDKSTSSLLHNSIARLDRSIARTLLGFRRIIPTLSVQAHHVLRVFYRVSERLAFKAGTDAYIFMTEVPVSLTWSNLRLIPSMTVPIMRDLPRSIASQLLVMRQWFVDLHRDLRAISFANFDEIDLSLIHWRVSEKVLCVVLGYALFMTVCYLYMKVSRRASGLKSTEKAPGMLADTLTQAGHIIKIDVFLGIETIVLPLYCGIMLDLALLPLFDGATLLSRFQSFSHTPLMALFVHWLFGRCYTLHCALFVSMCRKLMRKGVLYFISNPADPTFDRVRDVLERSVATQLGRIAFSALVHSTLIFICLGGVVSGLNKTGHILPLQWGVRDHLMIIPGDVIIYNSMLPFVFHKVDVSKRLSEVFGWWFRACAAGLRLSDFFFGVDNEDEKQAGTFLWKRFLRIAIKGNDDTKHAMVTYVEGQAARADRLFWIEAVDDMVDYEFVTSILEFSPRFEIISLGDKKSEAFVEFWEDDDMTRIRKRLDNETRRIDSRCRVKHVKDIKVDVIRQSCSRNTPVDTSAGSYVRAPAKDSVRIPKHTPVFLHVNEKNLRLDGQDGSDIGIHGKNDDRFSRIYIPNCFRVRLSAFIGLTWLFVAVMGLTFTVGPLLLGRGVIRRFEPSNPINDLYALMIGLHLLGIAIFTAYWARTWYSQSAKKLASVLKSRQTAIPILFVLMQRSASIAYLAVSLAFVTPMALSKLAELYINIPAFTYLIAGHTDFENPGRDSLLSTTHDAGTQSVTHLLQTWAMGLLYVRALLRFASAPAYEDTRPAVAIKAIVRGGLLKPDVKLASRALILPTLLLCTVLYGLPPLFARAAIALYVKKLTHDDRARLYRYAYPVLLTVALSLYTIRRSLIRIKRWRIKIRDEVYLIGERLLNFPDQADARSGGPARSGSLKGKEKATTVSGRKSTMEEKAATHTEGFFVSSYRHDSVQESSARNHNEKEQMDRDLE